MNNPTDHPSDFVLEVGRYTRKSDFFFPYEYGLPYLISLSKWVVEKNDTFMDRGRGTEIDYEKLLDTTING